MKVSPLILAVLLTSNVSASDIDGIHFQVDDYNGHLIVRNERMLNSTHQNEEGFSNFMSSLGYVRDENVVIDEGGVVTQKCPEGGGNLCPLTCLADTFKFPTDNGLFQIKVDVNIMDVVNTQFAEAAAGNNVLLPSVFNGQVLFPGLFTGEGEDKLSKSKIAKDSCSHLEFIGGHTIGAALQYGSASLCVAVNPCTHTYGVAQYGILPSIPLFNPPIGTFDINSIGFSLEKKLALTSGNEMFDGGFVTVHGHIALSGTGTIGLDLPREFGEPFAKLEQTVTTSLIIDLDPLNNGVVPQTDAVDFAFLLSGKTNTPVLTLNLDSEGLNQVKVDLPDMLEAMADLHVSVKGEDDTYVDFSSKGSITLYDLCKIALPLAPICVMFDDVTFTAAAKMKAGVKNGVGTFGMSFTIEADKPLEWSIDVMNEIGNPTASFGISLELHGGRLEACIQFAHHDRVCPDFCQENAECGYGYYCQGDEIVSFGVCKPLNPMGAHCILDEVCESKKCSSYLLNGECECEHDHHCEVDDAVAVDQKICITYEFAHNECEHKNLEVGEDCGEDRQCLSGNCFNDIGDHMCQCSNNNHCPGTQRCEENPFGANYCFAPYPIGDHCLYNNDCQSDKCSSHLLNGECECNRDSHCSGSNICIYYEFSSNECEPKNLGLGGSCGEDRQCNSGNCFTGIGWHTCQCSNDNHCPHECNTATFGANYCWDEPWYSPTSWF